MRIHQKGPHLCHDRGLAAKELGIGQKRDFFVGEGNGAGHYRVGNDGLTRSCYRPSAIVGYV